MPRTCLRIAALLLGALALCPRTSISAQSTFDAVTLLNDVRVLSDDALGGRLIGTAGADSAATFLARRFRQAGLRAAPGGWFQLFTVAPEAPAAIQAGIGGATGRNVIGVLPGHDQELRALFNCVLQTFDGGGRIGRVAQRADRLSDRLPRGRSRGGETRTQAG